MKRLLEGKVALVTGAGRGVGKGIALALAEAGASVVVNDLGASLGGEGRDDQPANEVVAAIRRAGGRAVAVFSSVSEWDAAQGMVAAAVKELGRLDIVVNNAGILRDAIFHRMTRVIGNFGQANYMAAKLGVAALSKAIAIDMHKFGVRSNAVAPFAWTRMIDSIPAETPEQKKRVEGLRKLVPEKIAPFVVALCSDAAKDVTGQIFGVRNNEIYLFSQPRPVKSAHRGEGWTPETVLETALPMMRPAFFPLDRSGDVFSWDPV
jgi:NAD(P)-dependent dehydrogenase (short-subunit alcohol dehydrogenase family)